MDAEEMILLRLAGHHLTAPSDTQTVVKDLCGVQAQFLSHALHGLSIRCDAVHSEGLVKSWTNRGTMHLFSMDDLPLFLHQGRRRFLRPVDTLESDAYISADRKAYFASLICDAIAAGNDERETLKAVCAKAGMTEEESRSLFDPWGGVIRALCEAGRICHKLQEKKAYQLCPNFEPMDENTAELELATRYFVHFGPATAADAAHFFGTTQKRVKSWLKQLPVTENILNGKAFYRIGGHPPLTQIPPCLFLAGFDQLMLGYEKNDSLFLPQKLTQEIFTRAGIVRPVILLNGRVAGWWNKKGSQLTVHAFETCDHDLIRHAARDIWGRHAEKIEFIQH